MIPLLLLLAAGVLAVIALMSDPATAAVPPDSSSDVPTPPAPDPGALTTAPTPDPAPRFTGAAAALPIELQQTILDVASAYGIDARLLAAFRLAENGPQLLDGTRGFGVLDPAAKKDFQTNAEWAAGTIRNTLKRYRDNLGKDPLLADGRVSGEFLAYIAYGGKGYSGYAPLRAANDPTNLNTNELGGVARYYWETEVA